MDTPPMCLKIKQTPQTLKPILNMEQKVKVTKKQHIQPVLGISCSSNIFNKFIPLSSITTCTEILSNSTYTPASLVEHQAILSHSYKHTKFHKTSGF